MLVLALALAGGLVLAGCAEVDRTVTQRDFLQDEHGSIERAIVWESNRYPDHQTHAGDTCWEAAVIGGVVPAPCLTARAILDESDPHAQAPVIAYAATALAILALLWFAARRVAWQASVARQSGGSGAPAGGGTDAIALMRGITQEKAAQRVATGGRRDVRWPALVGAAIAAGSLVPATLLIGYGATMAWAIHTGTAMFMGLAIAVVLLLLRLPPRPADPDAYISRLLFLGGATAVLTAGAFLAAVLIHAPLVELNGIAPLG